MIPRTCDSCGEPYIAQRVTSKFCSVRCRNRNLRGAPGRPAAQHSGPPKAMQVLPGESIEAATRAELDAGGRADTSLGRIALQLARRLDENRQESGMGVAAVVREHSRVLAEALKGAPVAADPVGALEDEMAARRASRRRAG